MNKKIILKLLPWEGRMNAFDILMKDYRAAKAGNVTRIGVAKANAVIRARRVNPIEGFKYPLDVPVVKWPRCHWCHRFAPFAKLDARIPMEERAVFTSDELPGLKECGQHREVVQYSWDPSESVSITYLTWLYKERPKKQRKYERKYIAGVMKSRVTATLSLQKMGLPNGHLIAYIVALAE